MRVCPTCGGLIADHAEEAIAGTPCSCLTHREACRRCNGSGREPEGYEYVYFDGSYWHWKERGVHP